MRIIFLGFIALSFSFTTFAQRPKIGFVYQDYILLNLPQTKQLKVEIDAKKQALDAQQKANSEKYQEKYLAYQSAMKDISTTTSESLNAVVKDLQEFKTKAETAQAKADSAFRVEARDKLMAIQQLMEETEKVVAKEKGYNYVFRRSGDFNNQESTVILLYAANGDKDNLSDAVIIKLGGTPPPKTEAAATPTAAPATKSAATAKKSGTTPKKK